MKKRNANMRIWVFVFAAMFVIMALIPMIHGLDSSMNEEDGSYSSKENAGHLEVEYHKMGSNNVLSYTINDFKTEELSINDNAHYSFAIEQEAVMLEKGYPELPVIARSMIIPDDQQMEINVRETSYVEYDSVSVAPSKGNLFRTEHPDPSLVPYEFGEVYSIDAWYPQEIATLREPYILRDFRGQVVEIYPFQYNPVRNILRVHTDITVEVNPVGVGGENIFHRTEPITTIQRDFARIYERRFINYGEILNSMRYDPVEEEGNMLVISHGDYVDAMAPFVNWKNSIGIPTELVTLADTGTTADSIKSYISSYYDTNGLTYVLLVGDNDKVTTFQVGGIINKHASDPTYSFLEGSDNYPEIFVGRFSASTVAHVETQVERSIYYEQNPDGEWRTKGMGIASSEGPGYEGLYDWEHMRILRNRIYDYDYTWIDEFYDGSQGGDDAGGNPTSAMVSSAFNEGRHLANYCGHGNTNGLATSGFSVTNINALTNDNKFAFFITVACLVGNFDASSNPCFGEAWLRATNNGAPTGGIAAFSASKSQSWAPPMSAQDEMMHLYTETYTDNIKITTGGIAFNGCMYMNDQYGSNGDAETAAWHMFGDPSLVITGELIAPGEPPQVTLTRPSGGETFTARAEENILWSASPGDDPIVGVDLLYSTDGGSSWNTIIEGYSNSGTYSWTVPNEHSSECMVRVIATDSAERTGQDTSSGTFNIQGLPPDPPENLDIQHFAMIEAVENGIFDGDFEPWILTRLEDEGEARWDSESYTEGGSIYVTSQATGSDNINTENSYWQQDITPTSNEITVSGVFQKNIIVDSGVGWTTQVHNATVDVLVHDTATGWQTVFIDEDTSTADWTDFESTYAPVGNVDSIRLRMHVMAEGDTGPMGGTHTGTGELWMDEFSVISVESIEGGEHNLFSWDAVQGDPDEVSHYNVYRSQDNSGPWDGTTLIGNVNAIGSTEYSYIDWNKGSADDIRWWYVVRGVGTNDLEDDNTNAVREPSAEIPTFDLVLSSGGAANGWNFVSFNLIPQDTSLESILEDSEYGISGNYDRVMYYDASSDRWYSYVPGRAEQFNNLQNWGHTMGLWIRMTAGATLTVEGTRPTSTAITLEPGWNMVGLPSESQGNHDLPSEVTSIGYFDTSKENNVAYSSGTAVFEFRPGEGYWVYNSANYAVTWNIEY
ncbi:MAG: C25 family cysteine peptidase [Thermoplasmata archaeon]